MKKLLLSLTACLLALPAMAAPAEIFTVKFGSAGNVSASNNSSYSETQVYTGKANTAVDGKEWTVVNFNNNNNKWSDLIKCGEKSSDATGSVATKFAFSQKITNVTANVVINYNNVTSANLYVSTDGKTWGTAVSSNSSIGKSTTSVSFDIAAPAANLYYKIDFVCKKGAAKNGVVSLKGIKYTGESGDPSLADPEVAFPEKAYTAKLGQDFAAPTATTAEGAPAVVYSSEDESVATVNAATGAVTLVAEGTTIIYAKTEANDEWNAGTASYTLTVKDPNKIFESALGDEFNFEKISGTVDPWKHDKTYGLMGSGYISRNNNAADAVAYYEITLPQGSYELNFDEAFNMYKKSGTQIDVSKVVDYAKIVVREKGATEWTTIAEPKAPEAFSWTFFANGPVSLNAYAGKTIEFGFRYISTTEVAGTWEIKNISIKKVEAVAPEAPAILVNGEEPTADTIEVEDGKISFGEVAEGVAIYFNVEHSSTTAPDQGAADEPNVSGGEIMQAPARENAAPVEKDGITYTLYTGAPVKLEDGSSVIRYFARANGLDSEVKTLTVSSTTGIEGVAVEEGAAVWYDLNGVRVAEPKKGLYIRVQGGKATKELRK